VILKLWRTIFSPAKKGSHQLRTMPECSIPYIPPRLKTDNRPALEEFQVGEFLYMRCRPESIQNPYKSISITELSHNRSGPNENALCNPDDVLYSIREDENFEKYVGLEICTLEIVSLNENNRYIKEYMQEKDGVPNHGKIELLHEPEPCMYPHSVFRIWFNGDIVTYNNYDSTIGKFKKLRTQIKEEIASMIRRTQVNYSDPSPQS
jgi:hypothetical protein